MLNNHCTTQKVSKIFGYYLKNSIFALFKYKSNKMKEKRSITLKVTESEEELIKAIRNYCDSYPNGHPDLLIFAQDIFDRMTLMPKE